MRMDYCFFNDKHVALKIHTASSTSVKELKPASKIVITIPDDKVPFIKIWETNIVLLSYADSEQIQNPKDHE